MSQKLLALEADSIFSQQFLNTHVVSRLKSPLFFPDWLCHFKGLLLPVWRKNSTTPVENSTSDIMTIDR